MVESFELKDISKYRSPIMGLAIILVMIHHFTITTPGLELIANNGFIGVDLFFFMSGLGLYYSWQNDRSYKRFIKKRLLRIVLPYIIFGVLFELIHAHDPFIQFCAKISTIGFWLKGDILSFEWFVPSIVLVYLIFPIIINLILSKHANTAVILCYISAFAIAYTKLIHFPQYFLVCRIPVFLLGALTAKSLISSGRQSFLVSYAIFGFIASIITELIPIDNLHIYYWGRTCLVASVVILSSLIMKNMRHVSSLLGHLGKFTLEIYLMHWLVLKSTLGIINNHNDLSTTIRCILSVMLGYVLYRSVNLIYNLFRKV